MPAREIRRLTLFSSYLTAPHVPFYIINYLKALKKHSAYLVYICADNVALNDEEMAKLRQFADEIVQVPNGGFDFGMWQKMLPRYDWNQVDELCLVNDSCICFNSLDGFFDWNAFQTASVTGIGGSHEQAYHLQSYFLNIKRAALADTLDFIAALDTDVGDIMQMVAQGEIGLSQYLLTRGHTLQAWFERTDNPTLFHITPMIRSGVPLVKKKALLRLFREIIGCIALGKDIAPFYELMADMRRYSDLADADFLQLFDFLDVYQSDVALFIGER